MAGLLISGWNPFVEWMEVVTDKLSYCGKAIRQEDWASYLKAKL